MHERYWGMRAVEREEIGSRVEEPQLWLGGASIIEILGSIEGASEDSASPRGVLRLTAKDQAHGTLF